jgi:hypothetical protein
LIIATRRQKQVKYPSTLGQDIATALTGHTILVIKQNFSLSFHYSEEITVIQSILAIMRRRDVSALRTIFLVPSFSRPV